MPVDDGSGITAARVCAREKGAVVVVHEADLAALGLGRYR
jgi:hypothetical protein